MSNLDVADDTMRHLVGRLTAIMLAAATLSACVQSAVAPLPPPPIVEVPPTSSSVPDFSATSIPPVGGQTTLPEVGVTPGAAIIQGRVLAGGTPVSDAVVRLERFVGDRSATVDIRTNKEGRYSAVGIAGGRYRIRAFRSPDVTMPEPVTAFVGADEVRNLDLVATRFGGSNTVSVGSSGSAQVGSTGQVWVNVTRPGVDSEGVARSMPVGGLTATLATSGGRSVVSSNPTATDGGGRAIWTYRCDSTDNQGLTAVFGDGTSTNLNLATCRPAPTTTTSTTTTTADVRTAKTDDRSEREQNRSREKNGNGNGRGNRGREGDD